MTRVFLSTEHCSTCSRHCSLLAALRYNPILLAEVVHLLWALRVTIDQVEIRAYDNVLTTTRDRN